MSSRRRTANPYRDLDVIDSRAPRANQAFVGTVALVAFLTGQAWLLGLLALQFALGLTLGRRWCVACVFYFEVIQPRFGEGPLEDSRPPRFANMVGFAFLTAAAIGYYAAGLETVAWVLALIVASLALLAAITGLCMGCEAYKLSARLRGVAAKHAPRIDPTEVGLSVNGGPRAFVHFTHPLCSECREWEERLARQGRPHVIVNVRDRPELAHKYGIAVVPTVVAVAADGTVLERLAP